jgi:hypothetical protein
VTPAEGAAGQSVFTVNLNTHSVDLNYDLKSLATLQDDQGHSYQALTWDGGSGGHHVSGSLHFEGIQPGAKWVALELKDIAGVPSRTFRWDVK